MSTPPLELHQLPAIGPAAVCMGVFDGVHRGHTALLDATVGAASGRGLASVALVFDPPPIEVIRPGTEVPRLAPLDENLRRITAAGIDHALPVRFTPSLRDLPPEEFLAALAPSIGVRALVLTTDSAFGRGRTGTPDAMRAHGAAAGFEVVVLERLEGDADGAISSSRVRALVADGDVESATVLLGRPPYLAGTVVHGDARGRELGYPTANLAFAYLPALPANGIYAGRVAVPAASVAPGHPALVSIGVRPTFEGTGRVLVEVHLLDYEGDLYDAELRLDVLHRLREERRFASVDALVDQMRVDERGARSLLGPSTGPQRAESGRLW